MRRDLYIIWGCATEEDARESCLLGDVTTDEQASRLVGEDNEYLRRMTWPDLRKQEGVFWTRERLIEEVARMAAEPMDNEAFWGTLALLAHLLSSWCGTDFIFIMYR